MTPHLLGLDTCIEKVIHVNMSCCKGLYSTKGKSLQKMYSYIKLYTEELIVRWHADAFCDELATVEIRGEDYHSTGCKMFTPKNSIL